MSTTAADTEEILSSLARMKLIEPGERPTLVPLAGGISSLIVRAETTRGAVCVKRALPQLRVAAEWFAPVERNSAEVAWLKLAANVVPGSVPEIVAEDVRGRAFAMTYLDPATHPVWKSQLLAGAAQAETARAVAANLARIHAATAGRADVARAFANGRTFHALRLEPYFAASALRHPDCARSLQALIETTAAARIALMHGDVSPKNILVGPRGPVLLDAEAACYGDPAFDVAFCLTHLMLKCRVRPASRRDFLACFDAFVSAYCEGVTWEPSGQLETRTCLLLAAMLLARVDGKSPVEYLTAEADRDAVRRFAKAHLHAPAASLHDMRRAWNRESTI